MDPLVGSGSSLRERSASIGHGDVGSEGSGIESFDSLDAATGGSLAYLVGSPGEVGRRLLHWIPGRRSLVC